jgi:hypothetical protein
MAGVGAGTSELVAAGGAGRAAGVGAAGAGAAGVRSSHRVPGLAAARWSPGAGARSPVAGVAGYRRRRRGDNGFQLFGGFCDL